MKYIFNSYSFDEINASVLCSQERKSIIEREIVSKLARISKKWISWEFLMRQRSKLQKEKEGKNLNAKGLIGSNDRAQRCLTCQIGRGTKICKNSNDRAQRCFTCQIGRVAKIFFARP